MKKVLVVDDSLSVARQLEKIIADSGDFTSVGHAKNGAEAIKMNHTENPDIICMDMNMPGMDGLTALRSLVVLDKDVKVVMVTSLGVSGINLPRHSNWVQKMSYPSRLRLKMSCRSCVHSSKWQLFSAFSGRIYASKRPILHIGTDELPLQSNTIRGC